MNFYQAQDDARKRTKLLLWYYVIAIVAIIIAIYAIISLVMYFQSPSIQYAEEFEMEQGIEIPGFWERMWNPTLLLTVAVGTSGVILVGTLFKKMQLSSGGAVIAMDLGGRPIDPNTTDAEERKLMNVVEEMAIASGTPVPQVWVMDQELGINAFAAGTEPGNAVIGVTRGCIQRLNRKELQGVIAHEFSHILNGDMKLNMRLVSLLFGILMISIIGRTVLYSGYLGGGNRRSNDNSGAVLLLIGIALLAIGAIGVFFARMIQAAISRQREYLADASAVQFTMDPSGIADALKKIGGNADKGNIKHPKAGEAEHMFFADGGLFSYGFASHPPLEERIGAIQNDWDGEFLESKPAEIASHIDQSQPEKKQGFEMQDMVNVAVMSSVLDKMGDPSQTNMGAARAIYNGLDESWLAACHDRDESQALIFGLLLAEDNKLRSGEVNYLKKHAGEAATSHALKWNDHVKELHSSRKIALVDLCIPTIRRLTLPEYERFIDITKWMISSDGHVDLFEFMLQKVLQRHLDAHFRGAEKNKMRYRSINQLVPHLNVLLSTICGVGAKTQDNLQSCFAEVKNELEQHTCRGVELLPAPQCGIDAINLALVQIADSTPLVKKQVLNVCGKAVMHDGVITSQESEILRATADAIGCSIPPFVKE